MKYEIREFDNPVLRNKKYAVARKKFGVPWEFLIVKQPRYPQKHDVGDWIDAEVMRINSLVEYCTDTADRMLKIYEDLNVGFWERRRRLREQRRQELEVAKQQYINTHGRSVSSSDIKQRLAQNILEGEE